MLIDPAKLKARRQATGHTQREVAERLGIQPVFLSFLETHAITPKLLNGLASTLNCNVADFTDNVNAVSHMPDEPPKDDDNYVNIELCVNGKTKRLRFTSLNGEISAQDLMMVLSLLRK